MDSNTPKDQEIDGPTVLEKDPRVGGDPVTRNEQGPEDGRDSHHSNSLLTMERSSATVNSFSWTSNTNWWPFAAKEEVSRLKRKNRDLEKLIAHLTETQNFKDKQHLDEIAKKDCELDELKQTLCMYDEQSEVDIGKQAESINMRVHALTRGLAAKLLKEASRIPDNDSRGFVDSEERERLTDVAGIQLVNALDAGRTKFGRLLLERVWQAAIVDNVYDLLDHFSASLAGFDKGPTVNRALHHISDAVMLGEVQPAFGRWRSVTHRYLKKVTSYHEDAAIQLFVEDATELCYTASKLALKSRCPDKENFAGAIHLQTKEIMEEASKLLTTIREKAMTINYEPYNVENGEAFRPDCMVLPKQDSPFHEDKVVCTTGLGVRYSRKQGRENNSEIFYDFLTKPEVFTEGNLSDMLAG